MKLGKISFLQSAGMVAYIALVAFVLRSAPGWFGEGPDFFGITFFLTLLVTSVLASGLLTLGYSAYLAFEKRKVADAIRLVAYTAVWLMFFATLIIYISVRF